MSKLKIYRFPDAVLAKKALPIARIESRYRKLADDMLETMYDAPGIGLAANQVGVLERILVMDTDYETDDLPEDEEGNPQFLEGLDGSEEGRSNVIKGKSPIIIINPELIYKEGKTAIKEGCLSVPGYCAEVDRWEKIKIRYQTIDGLSREMALDGLRAICFQHELDHLEGKLFIDRLSPLKKEMAKKKLIKDLAKKTETSDSEADQE